MSMSEWHVRPNPRGGWDVTGETPEDVSSHHDTDVQARAWAMSLLIQFGGGRLRVYGRDGQYEREERVSA